MRLSNTSQIALLALTAWFALNFRGMEGLVAAEPLLSLAGFNMALLLMLAIASLFRFQSTAPLLLVQLAIWAFLQVETHWRGYLLGASPDRLAWYERNWGAFWSFLPEIPGHTTPDGYHTILFALIVVTMFAALRDVMSRR